MTVFMRPSPKLCPLALALAALVACSALGLPASQPARAETLDAATTRAELDRLFDKLRRTRDATEAETVADEIRGLWRQSGSPTVDLLMQWASEAIMAKRNAAALDFLDQATLLKPDFAEGFNMRATFHYANGDRRKSMADINRVLELEPRHFGALAGMAAILTESGRDELALKAWERFLEVYPANRDAQEQVQTLSEKLAGSRS